MKLCETKQKTTSGLADRLNSSRIKSPEVGKTTSKKRSNVRFDNYNVRFAGNMNVFV